MLTDVNFFLALQQVVTSPRDKEEQEPYAAYQGSGWNMLCPLHWISVPLCGKQGPISQVLGLLAACSSRESRSLVSGRWWL